MPQLTNITIGSAISLPAITDRVFRVVPQTRGVQSRAFEHSVVGSPELATKIAADTERKSNGSQSTLLRISLPIIRSKDGVQERVDLNIAQCTFTMARVATEAEREELAALLVRAILHEFFSKVIVNGEAMT